MFSPSHDELCGHSCGDGGLELTRTWILFYRQVEWRERVLGKYVVVASNLGGERKITRSWRGWRIAGVFVTRCEMERQEFAPSRMLDIKILLMIHH